MSDTDRFLAQKLMGWVVDPYVARPWTVYLCDDQVVMAINEWHPSTDITQALGDGGPETVVEKMRERGWRLYLNSPSVLVGFTKASARFVRILDNTDGTPWFHNDLPAAAICEAARKALEVPE